MSWYSPDRFRTQAVLIGLTSFSMAVVAVLLVQDAWQSTREALTAEATQQCLTAVGELRAQFAERAALLDSREHESPGFAAQDVSLRGLSAAVLRSYEDTEGGFLIGRDLRMAGRHRGSFVFSASDTSELEDEAQLVGELAKVASTSAQPVVGSREDGNDFLVGCAAAIPDQTSIAWVLKRLSSANNPAAERRRWWLAGLVLLAILGVAMIVSISIRLRRGVEALHGGLARLEHDFDYRLPAIGGDFGGVAQAINRMAERRGALEATLRRQDRLAALGRVVSGVAHEIRNPLNSLTLTLELLARRIQKGAASGDEVREAIDEVTRLDQILARLLAFGRPDFRNRRLQDVRPLIDRSVRIVDDRAQSKGVRIVVDHAAGRPLQADVDALAIEQILINLLLNAVDASPAGGVVDLVAGSDGPDLRIAVTDHGSGINGTHRDQLFNPFFTTKANGTGLGLALSREMASHHGGSLEFEPSSGGGATFVLRLPSHPESV